MGLTARTVREGFSELLDVIMADPELGSRSLSLPAADGPRRPTAMGRSRLLVLPGDSDPRPWLVLGVAPGPLEEPSEAAVEGEPIQDARILVLLSGNRSLRPDARTRIQATLADPAVEKAILEAAGPEEILAIPALAELELERPLRVQDIMVPLSFRVYAHTPVSEVLGLIARRRLSAVPVVDENLQVLGVVSAGEALERALRHRGRAARGKPPDTDATVREIMTRSVLCVSEDQLLMDAAELMANRGVAQLPVVREGELVGFLTRDGVLFALFGESEADSTRTRSKKDTES